MKWVGIGSDNGLSPGRHQAIIWTNADICQLEHKIKFQWNFSWNSNIFIHENAFEHVVCEMAAILFRGDFLKLVCLKLVCRQRYPANDAAYSTTTIWGSTYFRQLLAGIVDAEEHFPPYVTIASIQVGMAVLWMPVTHTN